MALTTQDFVAGIDPTGLLSISGTELLQLIQAGYFADGVGGVLTTTDTAPDVPDVPDAVTTEKWQRYLWRRITDDEEIVIYAWKPSVVVVDSYLKWVDISSVSLAPNSIPQTALQPITDPDKVLAVNWTAIQNPPSFLLPSTTPTVQTQISGSYTNGFTINAGIITESMLATAIIPKFIQRVYVEVTATDSSSTVRTINTNPLLLSQVDELSGFNLAITPQRVGNIIVARLFTTIACGSVRTGVIGLWMGIGGAPASGDEAVSVNVFDITAAATRQNVYLINNYTAAALTTLNFRVGLAVSSAATLSVNSTEFNSKGKSYLELIEIRP